MREIMDELIRMGVILKGHFILSSGLHSDTYVQCAKIFTEFKIAFNLCKELSQKIHNKLGKDFADVIISPAIGGIIVGYEMGRQLSLPSLFCERVKGKFQLRRGFQLKKNSRILLVEDVVTTGKSSLEVANYIKDNFPTCKIVAEACLVDRRNNLDNFPFKLISLIKLAVKLYQKDDLPESLKKIIPIKPGSRFSNS